MDSNLNFFYSLHPFCFNEFIYSNSNPILNVGLLYNVSLQLAQFWEWEGTSINSSITITGINWNFSEQTSMHCLPIYKRIEWKNGFSYLPPPVSKPLTQSLGSPTPLSLWALANKMRRKLYCSSSENVQTSVDSLAQLGFLVLAPEPFREPTPSLACWRDVRCMQRMRRGRFWRNASWAT